MFDIKKCTVSEKSGSVAQFHQSDTNGRRSAVGPYRAIWLLGLIDSPKQETDFSKLTDSKHIRDQHHLLELHWLGHLLLSMTVLFLRTHSRLVFGAALDAGSNECCISSVAFNVVAFQFGK